MMRWTSPKGPTLFKACSIAAMTPGFKNLGSEVEGLSSVSKGSRFSILPPIPGNKKSAFGYFSPLSRPIGPFSTSLPRAKHEINCAPIRCALLGRVTPIPLSARHLPLEIQFKRSWTWSPIPAGGKAAELCHDIGDEFSRSHRNYLHRRWRLPTSPQRGRPTYWRAHKQTFSVCKGAEITFCENWKTDAH
jgi:hypothetical protein